MWNETNSTRHFPNSDGSFNLEHEDVQAGSRLFVELPDTSPSNSRSGPGNVCRCSSLSPRAGKQLRIEGAGVVDYDSNRPNQVKSNHGNYTDVFAEILKLQKEMKGDIRTIRRDVAMLLSQGPT